MCPDRLDGSDLNPFCNKSYYMLALDVSFPVQGTRLRPCSCRCNGFGPHYNLEMGRGRDEASGQLTPGMKLWDYLEKMDLFLGLPIRFT